MTPEIERFARSCGPHSWTRVLIACQTIGIRKVKDFEKIKETEIRSRKSIGKKTFERLQSQLAARGVKMIPWSPNETSELPYL